MVFPGIFCPGNQKEDFWAWAVVVISTLWSRSKSCSEHADIELRVTPHHEEKPRDPTYKHLDEGLAMGGKRAS